MSYFINHVFHINLYIFFPCVTSCYIHPLDPTWSKVQVPNARCPQASRPATASWRSGGGRMPRLKATDRWDLVGRSQVGVEINKTIIPYSLTDTNSWNPHISFVEITKGTDFGWACTFWKKIWSENTRKFKPFFLFCLGLFNYLFWIFVADSSHEPWLLGDDFLFPGD